MRRKIALGVLFSLWLLPSCDDSAQRERTKALEEKVAKLEEQLESLQKLDERVTELENAPTTEERRVRDEQLAAPLLAKARESMAAFQFKEAEATLNEILQKYPKSKVARSAKGYARDVAVIGRDAGTLDVAKWYTGSAAMDTGNPTVLIFWEVWCPHCKREVPKLEMLYQEYKSRGVNLVALTKLTKSATEAQVQTFIVSQSLSFPSALEKDGSMSKRFNVTSIPAAAVVKDGKIVWRGHPKYLADGFLERWL